MAIFKHFSQRFENTIFVKFFIYYKFYFNIKFIMMTHIHDEEKKIETKDLTLTFATSEFHPTA